MEAFPTNYCFKSEWFPFSATFITFHDISGVVAIVVLTTTREFSLSATEFNKSRAFSKRLAQIDKIFPFEIYTWLCWMKIVFIFLYGFDYQNIGALVPTMIPSNRK